MATLQIKQLWDWTFCLKGFLVLADSEGAGTSVIITSAASKGRKTATALLQWCTVCEDFGVTHAAPWRAGYCQHLCLAEWQKTILETTSRESPLYLLHCHLTWFEKLSLTLPFDSHSPQQPIRTTFPTIFSWNPGTKCLCQVKFILFFFLTEWTLPFLMIVSSGTYVSSPRLGL